MAKLKSLREITKKKELFIRRKETDLNFKLASDIGTRTDLAFKTQKVRQTTRTSNILQCSHSFFKNLIIHNVIVV